MHNTRHSQRLSSRSTILQRACPYGGQYSENRQNHFAICAFPADYGNSGEDTYIINEEGTIYMLDRGIGEPIKQWPGDDPMQQNWEVAF